MEGVGRLHGLIAAFSGCCQTPQGAVVLSASNLIFIVKHAACPRACAGHMPDSWRFAVVVLFAAVAAFVLCTSSHSLQHLRKQHAVMCLVQPLPAVRDELCCCEFVAAAAATVVGSIASVLVQLVCCQFSWTGWCMFLAKPCTLAIWPSQSRQAFRSHQQASEAALAGAASQRVMPCLAMYGARPSVCTPSVCCTR